MTTDDFHTMSMRARRGKTLIITAVLVVLGTTYWMASQSGKSPVVDPENPFHVDRARDTQHVLYPTRAKGYVVPTRSAAEMREILLGQGMRQHVDDNPIHMPALPFGNVSGIKDETFTSYDDNVNPHDLYQLQVDALQAEDLNPGTLIRATVMPRLEGVNIVAMTLYGSGMKYTLGALKNAELIKVNFPGWQLRVYTETPSASPRYGIVPQTVLDRLRVLGADIHYIDPAEDWVPPMMWRFLVADDPWVDRFIIRDSDGRLTQRDAAAVYAWVQSDKPFNCIRDHPSHASYAVSGGMWGGKPKELTNIFRRSWREMMQGVGKDYLEDMHFLNGMIWPKVSAHAYCSDSVSCDQFEGAHPFPVPRYGYEHVGQVVSENDLGRPIDIAILKQAGENPKCTPQGYDRLGMPKVIASEQNEGNRTSDNRKAVEPG